MAGWLHYVQFVSDATANLLPAVTSYPGRDTLSRASPYG